MASLVPIGESRASGASRPSALSLHLPSLSFLQALSTKGLGTMATVMSIQEFTPPLAPDATTPPHPPQGRA